MCENHGVNSMCSERAPGMIVDRTTDIKFPSGSATRPHGIWYILDCFKRPFSPSNGSVCLKIRAPWEKDRALEQLSFLPVELVLSVNYKE